SRSLRSGGGVARAASRARNRGRARAGVRRAGGRAAARGAAPAPAAPGHAAIRGDRRRRIGRRARRRCSLKFRSKEKRMETVIRGIAVYAFLLVVMRLSGRRTLAQVTPFDFVVLLIVAETTQQALLADDYSLVNCFVLVLTLFVADIVLSYVKEW